MTTKQLIRSEVIESPCCKAPSTLMAGPETVDPDKRRCVRCKQVFIGGER